MKSFLKRTVSFALLFAVITSVFIPSAFAVDSSELIESEAIICTDGIELQTPDAPIELPYRPSKETRSRAFSSSRVDYTAILLSVEQLIKEALIKGEKSVDLTPYEIYPSDINLGYLVYFSPYISNSIDIACYYYYGSFYSSIEISTDMSEDDLKHHVANVDEKIAKLSDLLSVADSDLEKALIIHDYFIYTCEYDYENYSNGTVPANSYRSYGIMMDNIGVCQSYAYAFMYLMVRQGIECHIASSTALGHAWNIINIDGEYYHVDLTWDDPVYDRLGKVSHEHFLLSDAAISTYRGTTQEFHYGWDRTDLVCDSTRYDNESWINIVSQIIHYNGSAYYIKGNSIYKYNTYTGKETVIASLGKWTVWGNKYSTWNGSYSGLFLYDGELYYNTSTQIRKISLNTLSDKLVFTPDTSNGYVYGCTLVGSTFKYAINQDPNNKNTVISLNFADISSWKKVTLNDYSIVMYEEDTYTLIPGEITEGLVWTSDNDYVASVSSDGVITANNVGITDITVHAPNGSVATCVVLVLSHTFGSWTVTSSPTCTKNGTESKSCLFCGETKTREIPALGHNPVYHDAKSSTCTEAGWTAYETCKRCDHSTYAPLPLASHSFGDWVTVTEPTDEEDGLCERYCSNCTEVESKIIPSTRHEHSYSSTVFKPTCTAKGYTVFLCECGDTYEDDVKKELGHDFSDFFTIDIEATNKNAGEKSRHCSRCEERADITALPMLINSSEMFSDIPSGEWFKTSVDFVVSNGLMKGVGTSTFDPEGTMTRAMVVTVLYRMEGQPAVKGNAPFSDLAEDWYKDPVAWAYENVIVKGTGVGAFSPDGEITREQLATILYRYSDYKKYDVSASEDIGSFPDASDTDDWATSALKWAFGEGLITGSSEGGSTYLKPLGDATRAQVATILTRFCKKH